jgi:hypothetical protein
MGAKKLIVEYPHVFTFQMKRWGITPLKNVKDIMRQKVVKFYHVVPWVREPLEFQFIKLKNRE